MTTLFSAPRARAKIAAGASNCNAYLKLTFSPCAVNSSTAPSDRLADTRSDSPAFEAKVGAVGVANSSFARVWMIVRISAPV